MIDGVVIVLQFRSRCTEPSCATVHEGQLYALPVGANGPLYATPPGWHIVNGRMICEKHEVIIAKVQA